MSGKKPKKTEKKFKQESILDKISVNRNILKFVGLLIFYSITLIIIFLVVAKSQGFFIELTAKSTTYALNLLSIDALLVEGSKIKLDGLTLDIIFECTGVLSMIAYAACTLSYPTTWKSRGIGILIGIPALFLINIIRIVFLAIVGLNYSAQIFDYMHGYLWHITLIIFVVLIWLLWIERIVENRSV